MGWPEGEFYMLRSSRKTKNAVDASGVFLQLSVKEVKVRLLFAKRFQS